MSDQPRGPGGRFVCVPSFPRKVTSSCGCAGGGSRPCPIRRRHAALRQDARNVARRALRARRLAEDVRELEEELWVARADREATREALVHTREQIRNAGRVHHRAGGRSHGFAVHGSEDAYRELLDRRGQESAHLRHADGEVRAIRRALTRARARARARGRRIA